MGAEKMIDGQNVVWGVFHNRDLDKAVDKAHNDLPIGYEVQKFDVQKIDDEFLVTVIAKWGLKDE